MLFGGMTVLIRVTTVLVRVTTVFFVYLFICYCYLGFLESSDFGVTCAPLSV